MNSMKLHDWINIWIIVVITWIFMLGGFIIDSPKDNSYEVCMDIWTAKGFSLVDASFECRYHLTKHHEKS